jgi:hypothetical protein
MGGKTTANSPHVDRQTPSNGVHLGKIQGHSRNIQRKSSFSAKLFGQAPANAKRLAGTPSDSWRRLLINF